MDVEAPLSNSTTLTPNDEPKKHRYIYFETKKNLNDNSFQFILPLDELESSHASLNVFNIHQILNNNYEEANKVNFKK